MLLAYGMLFESPTAWAVAGLFDTLSTGSVQLFSDRLGFCDSTTMGA